MSQQQRMVNSRPPRKSSESFMSWNEPRVAQGVSQSQGATPSHFRGKGDKTAPSMSLLPPSGRGTKVPIFTERTARLKNSGRPMDRGAGSQRQSTMFTEKGSSDEETSSAVPLLMPGHSVRAESTAKIPKLTPPSSIEGMQSTRGGGQTSLKNLPTNTLRTSLAEEAHRHSTGKTPVSQTKTVMQHGSSAMRGRSSTNRASQSMSSSSRGHALMCSGAHRGTERPLTIQEAEEGSGEHEVHHGANEELSAERQPDFEADLHAEDFEQPLDDAMVEADEYVEESDCIAETDKEHGRGRMEVHELTWGDKSRRRKERRLAHSMRERERDIRRREGRPRNFLLVDEYTRKPYGVGVGDWRKELMLLSRKLDPAINHINKQPQGAVAEIAEWIQHTWEYSVPVRFESVKEVVARGVNLRRSEMWKRIRNNEPKPEDLCDRSWRILRKQLQNPATAKKSEACSRANAMRLNFAWKNWPFRGGWSQGEVT